MRVAIPKDDPARRGLANQPPGAYWYIWRSVAMLTCANGHIASLGDHVVLQNGDVQPSVVCPQKECGYHEFVTLEDWVP